MSFDRKCLDSHGFILPTENSSHRAQIPIMFIQFALAVGTVEIPDGAKGKKFVITGAELIALFSVLRSKPPTHRWKGQSVEAEMKRLGLGGNRVRAMLKYLSDEGWIRYIEILLPDGRNGGTITEVRYRRLPKTEAGKKRKLRPGRGREVRIFEEDGVTAVDGADYPAKFLIDDIDSARPYGKDSDPVEWEPYTRPSGTREPSERSPGERSPGELYKEHHSEDHRIEITPFIPRSATGEPNSTILGEENQEVPEAAGSGSRLTSSDAVIPVTAVTAVTPSTPGPSLEQLTAELVKLGREAVRSPDDRIRYELFVKDHIVPLLDNPEAPDRWTASAAKAWLSRSLKAQVLLALCSDDRWTESLLRSFGKRCGSYAKDDLWKVLLCFNWATKNRPTLSYLVQADSGRATMKGWASFKKPLLEKFEEQRLETQCSLSSLQCVDGLGDVASVERFINEEKSRRSDFLIGKAQNDEVFRWLFFMWISRGETWPIDTEKKIEEAKREYHDRIVDLLASSRSHLAVASSMHPCAGAIWGVEWSEVRARHRTWVDYLNQRASIYGEEPAETLFHLIDGPLSLDETGADSGHPIRSAPGVPETLEPRQLTGVSSAPPSGHLPAPTVQPTLPAPVEVPIQAKGSEDLDAARVFHPSAEDLAAGYTSALRGS